MKKVKYFVLLFFTVLSIAVIYLNSVSFLTSLLYSDTLRTRRWGVDGLISKGPSVAMQVLGIAQNANEDVEVRREAVFILGEIPNENIVADLVALIEGSAPELLRAQAVYSLRNMQDSMALNAIITAYRTGAKSVRAKALMAMGEMTAPEIIPVLKEALSDHDQFLRDVASAALDRKGSNQ